MSHQINKNPWREIASYLQGEDEILCTRTPEMLVLYGAVRDFVAHFTAHGTNLPVTMQPQHELPMLLFTAHQMDLHDNPYNEAEDAINNTTICRMDFSCGDTTWNPTLEPFSGFLQRMKPAQVTAQTRHDRSELVIIKWRDIYKAAKERHECSVAYSQKKMMS